MYGYQGRPPPPPVPVVHTVVNGIEKPVIIAAKELKNNGLITASRKDVYLWVDITGLKCIERQTKRVMRHSPFDEITAWLVESDCFKARVLSKTGNVKERVFLTGYGKAMAIKMAIEERVVLYLQNGALVERLLSAAAALPVGTTVPPGHLESVPAFGDGSFINPAEAVPETTSLLGRLLRPTAAPLAPVLATPPTPVLLMPQLAPAQGLPFATGMPLPPTPAEGLPWTPPPETGAAGPSDPNAAARVSHQQQLMDMFPGVAPLEAATALGEAGGDMNIAVQWMLDRPSPAVRAALAGSGAALARPPSAPSSDGGSSDATRPHATGSTPAPTPAAPAAAAAAAAPPPSFLDRAAFAERRGELARYVDYVGARMHHAETDESLRGECVVLLERLRRHMTDTYAGGGGVARPVVGAGPLGSGASSGTVGSLGSTFGSLMSSRPGTAGGGMPRMGSGPGYQLSGPPSLTAAGLAAALPPPAAGFGPMR